ncbi:hypothetical protein [Micromonospora sp. NPDC049679]|uniref:hypothetical protein n=1 Tax=Micromonospora sp. NPDC049679 TaxID=3155920 RepID=UPI0033CD3DFA
MKNRRWSAAALITASVLTLGLAACNGDSGAASSAGASPTPAIPADPKQALLDSTKEIEKGHFSFTMKDHETSGNGIMHLPTRSALMVIKSEDPEMSMNMEIVHVQPETWVKLTFGGELASLPGMEKLSSGKYLHLDQSKAKDLKDLQFEEQDADPAGADEIFKAIVDATKTGEGAYSGTADLSKATEAGMVDEDLVKELGAQANAVPFEATLDPQGRLTSLTLKMPAAGKTKAHDVQVAYADYGSATPPQKPAASQTQEAPAEAYEMFK